MQDPDRKAFYQNLTRKIRLLILVVSFFPMVLTSGILCYRFHFDYKERVNAHVSELVLKHTRNIDAFLLEKLGNIRYLARQFTARPPESVQGFLVDSLAHLRDSYGEVFTDLGLVDSHGRQLAYEGPFRLTNADYSGAAWFQNAMENPYYISDVFAGLRGHPHFILAVKAGVRGQTYILRATINFTAFNTLVENIRIGKTGIAYIVNAKGEQQTRTGAGDPVHTALESGEQGDLKTRGTVTVRRADIHGRPYLIALSRFKNIDWCMVFHQDLDDALVDLRETELLTLAVFALGCIAILSVSFALPRGIVRLIARSDHKSDTMNRQVVESGKLAAIGELAAGIAHEINNPVAIMVEEAGWMGDLLEEETTVAQGTAKEFRRALDQIATQGRRCKDITHKLLSFARKSDCAVAEIFINDTIREIVSLTAQMARYNNVTIRTDLGADLPWIRFSPAELQQVILNLINNAIDAMGREGGVIRIRTGINPDDPGFILIEVRDNGPGIPSQNLDRVFDPFFTTKPVGQGTGLGLSICYGIIRKMGGRIEVESAAGQGTSFYISLPLSPEDTFHGSDGKIQDTQKQTLAYDDQFSN